MDVVLGDDGELFVAGTLAGNSVSDYLLAAYGGKKGPRPPLRLYGSVVVDTVGWLGSRPLSAASTPGHPKWRSPRPESRGTLRAQPEGNRRSVKPVSLVPTSVYAEASLTRPRNARRTPGEDVAIPGGRPSLPEAEETPEWLLERARIGDAEAAGRLLERYRNFLRIVARSIAGPATRARADPSDLVQETFLKAHREFRSFVGSGEPEVVAWLRKILARNLADQAKYDRRQRRDARHQESLDAMLDRSSLAVASRPSPRRSPRPATGRPAARRP